MIDFTKYKRFFAFGCSYTRYLWPTWADVISKEIPNAEFYNCGYSGSGNQLISYRLAEVNNKFKLTKDDLVMVMFSSYCREDRWIADFDNTGRRGWIAGGNVFAYQYYSKEWVRKFADEQGYIIRDAAIIDMSVRYIESLPCDSHFMLSVPFDLGAEDNPAQDEEVKKIKELYVDSFSKISPSIFEIVTEPNINELEYDYDFNDGHLSTIRHYEYLTKIGFKLSPHTLQYALDMSNILKPITDRNLVPLYFTEQNDMITRMDKLLF